MRFALLVVAALSFGACTEKKEEPEDIDFGHPVAAEPAKVEVKAPEVKAAVAAPSAAAEPTNIAKITISTDAAAIAQGKDLFAAKGCVGCHKIGGGKLVGPDLKGVTARREPGWLARMILHPEVMVKDDEVAKKLLVEHLVPMPNQNVDAAKELPAILAYLKSAE